MDTTPSGALVSIDGDIAGVTPLRLRHLPSRWHVVTLEREGFSARDTLVYADGEVPTSVSLALSPSAWGEDHLPRPQPKEFLEAEAPRVEPPTPTTSTPGTIGVRVSPSGVPVQLDGETVGVAPLELNDVPPGSHTLTFFLPGYETATVEVDVEPGAREPVDVTLVPQVGNLAVVVHPWGSIYVNDTLRARNTDIRFDTTLPVGRHQIRVEHPELGAQERTVEVQPRRTASVVFNFD